uniref:Luquin 2 n=1 Tax=Deroceras reticulatum TaxID=145610 RepID=A0A1X9WEG6_DERRE|nr:luquin 2 [Deroceras reticulatum]
MRAMQHTMVSCCLLVVIMCTLGEGTKVPPWKPQGRFGKRQSLRSEGGSLVPAIGFLTNPEVPVEALFTDTQMAQFQTKPRLCSVSGNVDYPVCEFTGPLSRKDSRDSSSFFDL